jgi:hypothetical protein
MSLIWCGEIEVAHTFGVEIEKMEIHRVMPEDFLLALPDEASATWVLNGGMIFKGPRRFSLLSQTALPESEALPSVGFFAECLLSGTRQRKLCRVPHSVKLGTRQNVLCRELNTRHRTTLGKDNFAECQTLGKGGSRQTAVSGRPKADGR